MNISHSNFFRAAFFTSALLAAVTLLTACDQVVSSANAASVSAPVSNPVVYFGDEYAAEQQALVADARAQAATF